MGARSRYNPTCLAAIGALTDNCHFWPQPLDSARKNRRNCPGFRAILRRPLRILPPTRTKPEPNLRIRQELTKKQRSTGLRFWMGCCGSAKRHELSFVRAFAIFSDFNVAAQHSLHTGMRHFAQTNVSSWVQCGDLSTSSGQQRASSIDP